MLTLEMLRRQWPHGDIHIPGLIEAMAEQAPALFAKYGINTPTIAAIFMGQMSLECGAGYEVVENLNYTAERMTQVWPRRFPTVASAEPYQHNPEALANKVYGGRMGNTQPGYGWKYRGRGGSQTTGFEGYATLQKASGLPLLDNPDLVNDPKYFLQCALADFIACGCLPFAQRGDIEGTTLKLNGGLTGLADREIWTKRWLHEFANTSFDLPQVAAPPIAPAPAKPPAASPALGAPAPAGASQGLAAFVSALLRIFRKK